MKKLFVYLKPYWKAVALAPLLMMLEVVCDLLQPTLMARIVDHGIASGNTAYILRTGALMVAIGLAGMIGGMGCTFFSSIASRNSAPISVSPSSKRRSPSPLIIWTTLRPLR